MGSYWWTGKRLKVKLPAPPARPRRWTREAADLGEDRRVIFATWRTVAVHAAIVRCSMRLSPQLNATVTLEFVREKERESAWKFWEATRTRETKWEMVFWALQKCPSLDDNIDFTSFSFLTPPFVPSFFGMSNYITIIWLSDKKNTLILSRRMVRINCNIMFWFS